jgi:uncharacterized membrane protein YfcA
MLEGRARLWAIFPVACGVGVLGGLFGVGGGVLLIPMLILLFHFEQHKAQGTSLIALVPPTGLLAFLEYYRAHEAHVGIGLLIMPGIFLGGVLGSKLALKLTPFRMRRMFAVFLVLIGFWQIYHSWLS